MQALFCSTLRLYERARFFHTQVIPYEGIMMKLIKPCSSVREKDPAAASLFSAELKKNKEGKAPPPPPSENGWKIFSLSAQIIKHTRALV